MKPRWIFLLTAVLLLSLTLGCEVQISNDYSGYTYYYSGYVTSANGDGIAGVPIYFNNIQAYLTDSYGYWRGGFSGQTLTIRPERRGFIFSPSRYYISNNDHSENNLNFTVTSFIDDFTYNDTGWAVNLSDPDGIYQYTSSNEYQIRVNTNTVYFTSPAPIYMGSNYTVTARVRPLSGSGYCGLAFNMAEGSSSYFVFRIDSANQKYELVRLNGGIPTSMYGPTLSSDIFSGTSNLLKVEQNGTKIYLSVNGILLYQRDISSYIQGSSYICAGLYAWSNSPSAYDVRFDDFELYSAVIANSLMLKAKNLNGLQTIFKGTER